MRTRILAAALLLGLTASARAAPSVTVSALAGATALPLDGEGSATTHIVQVANLDCSTTDADGFTLHIGSGSLTDAGNHTPITFQVAIVADGAGAPAASAFTAASGTDYTFATFGPGATAHDIYIKYTPRALQHPGAYAASFNLSINDN